MENETVTLTDGRIIKCPDVLDVPCWECEYMPVCPRCEYAQTQNQSQNQSGWLVFDSLVNVTTLLRRWANRFDAIANYIDDKNVGI